MNAIATVIGSIVVLCGTVVFFGLLMSLPVMLLWDWLMPILFGLGTITWLQAWGLLVLCGFMFKSSKS